MLILQKRGEGHRRVVYPGVAAANADVRIALALARSRSSISLARCVRACVRTCVAEARDTTSHKVALSDLRATEQHKMGKDAEGRGTHSPGIKTVLRCASR